jgi:hypothetical protein
MNYIKLMSGSICEKQGYSIVNELELRVQVSFDSKEFNRIKKTQDPLAFGMVQIKNVVFEAVNIRSVPEYSPISYSQRYPRAKNGLVTVTLTFDVDPFTARRLGTKTVDLQSQLDETRNDGHLLTKTFIK